MNLTEWIISIMEQLGYLGIALLMFLDNVFPPIPSEIIMPSAGYSASQGATTAVGVIIAGRIGSLLAAAVLYWIGYKFNHDSIFRCVDRYGKYLFIKSARCQKISLALVRAVWTPDCIFWPHDSCWCAPHQYSAGMSRHALSGNLCFIAV